MKTKTNILILALPILLLLPMGCSSPEKRLAKFSAQIDQIGAAISPGMSYSEVIARVGRPSYCATNGNVLTAVYRFDPPQFSSTI